jgi:hypothetical protein
MTLIESIVDINSLSRWLNLQTNISKLSLEKQLNNWEYNYNKLKALSNKFKCFKNEIKKDNTFFDECNEIFRELADCEKKLSKLINSKSDLEKESYNEILFFRPFLQPLNFIPLFLTAWSFIRVYLLPGLSFLVPFITLIAPYLILRFAFNTPITFNKYMNMLHSMVSGKFNEILNPSTTISSISPSSFIKQFGIILFTFIQGIIQPYWTYKHLNSIDNIILENGKLILKFRYLYEKLYNTLSKRGFTFFKCPLPEFSGERDAVAHIILNPSYIKLSLKYIGSLEVIMSLANCKYISSVRWEKYNKYNKYYYKIKNTFDYNVLEETRKTFSFNTLNNNHSLLTGPNKGGKSTVLRALSFSALLAHTYGCIIGDYCEMTPFSKIYVCLKPDDLPGSKSRFEREIEFTANTLKDKEPNMIFIDELYHSTNPPDALRSCEIYCKQLWDMDSISVISTHLFDLVKNAPNTINKICCPATIMNDKIQFSYSLQHGICEVSSVDELLRSNGLLCNL